MLDTLIHIPAREYPYTLMEFRSASTSLKGQPEGATFRSAKPADQAEMSAENGVNANGGEARTEEGSPSSPEDDRVMVALIRPEMRQGDVISPHRAVLT